MVLFTISQSNCVSVEVSFWYASSRARPFIS
jgi:hypothetical protein